MHVFTGVLVLIVLAIVVAWICFIAGKNNYHGVPLLTTGAVGHYKILSVVKTEGKESFAITERTEDRKITCINTTPLKEECLVVGNVLFL